LEGAWAAALEDLLRHLGPGTLPVRLPALTWDPRVVAADAGVVPRDRDSGGGQRDGFRLDAALPRVSVVPPGRRSAHLRVDPGRPACFSRARSPQPCSASAHAQHDRPPLPAPA